MRIKPPHRNILITGGAGFIGSHLVDRLLQEGGWMVTVIDNFDPFYAEHVKRANIAVHTENPRFKLYQVDICQPRDLREVFEKHRFEVIVHLAARAGVRPSLAEPGRYIETNVTGTLHLLNLAKEFGVNQFVFGSSSSVYGAHDSAPFSEEARTASPISPYAASKASAELLCHTYSHLYGIRCICLRFFTVYGPRQRPDLAIHKFAHLIHKGEPIPVYGDGTTQRDYTYVGDIVQGLRAAIEFRESKYDIINLGEENTVELNRLIALLEECLGRKASIKRLHNQPGDVPSTFADVSKARQLLGYNPSTKIEVGLPKFVGWFLSQLG